MSLLFLDRRISRTSPGPPSSRANARRRRAANLLRSLETEIFSFSSIISQFRLMAHLSAPSELLNQPKVEAVGLGKIDRHAGGAAANADAPSRPDSLRSSRCKQRLDRQRSRTRSDRLEKPQSLVIRLPDRARRRRVAAERASYWQRKTSFSRVTMSDKIAGRAEQVFGVVGANSKQHGFVHRTGQTNIFGASPCSAKARLKTMLSVPINEMRTTSGFAARIRAMCAL